MTVSDYHDPTNSDDVFHKLLTVDNRRCFIEVIDTAGHGACRHFTTDCLANRLLDR